MRGGLSTNMSAELPRADRWGRLANTDENEHAISILESIGAMPSERAARTSFLAALDLAPGASVLDVGAGTGVVTLDVAQRVRHGGHVVALDLHPALLAVAQAKAQRAGLDAVLETCVGDARALPWPAASFDAALCHWLLIHVAPPATIVAEMCRVVRPGGKVLCVEADWETAVVHPGDRAVTRAILHASCDRHLDGWMGRKLRSLVIGCGLRDVRVLPLAVIDTGEDGDGWLDYLRARPAIAEAAGTITREQGAAWRADLEAAVREGRYFFGVTQFAVHGVVG